MQFRRILDQIRGRSYEEALMILEFLPHRACDSILPTLMSVSLPGWSTCYVPSLLCTIWIYLLLQH